MVIFLTFITHKYMLAICSILSLNEHRLSKEKLPVILDVETTSVKLTAVAVNYTLFLLSEGM